MSTGSASFWLPSHRRSSRSNVADDCAAASSLLRQIRELDPEIVVMEGTGITGGAVLLALRALAGRPYIVSSGDAVAPFLAAIVTSPRGRPACCTSGLCAGFSSGFIGWSPYLVGRALTFGSPRSMTARELGQPRREAPTAAPCRRRSWNPRGRDRVRDRRLAELEPTIRVLLWV